MVSARKLIAFISLATVLLVTLTPASATLFWAIVVPLLLFTGLLVATPAACRHEQSALPNLLCVRDISSRAPPAAAPLN